jgi:hypothetical protein
MVGAIALAVATGTIARAEIALVNDRQPVATIVIPDDALPVVRYAANELIYHVQRATGAVLKIVTESQAASDATPRVYLGRTRAAGQAGIVAEQLAPETFTLKSADGAFFIVGGDASGDPLDNDTFAGTLFGVYELLERELGVRWLWPGALGTYVPKASSIRLHDRDETISPAFFQRNVRGGLTFKGKNASLGFTPAAAVDYAHDQAVFLRRHRVGKSVRITYHHAFTDWWRTYGAAHPEWFQLVNGKRGPTKPGGSYSMCVSNPDFRHEIIARWLKQRESNPGLHYVNAVENGIMGLCECANCRAWDGPTPADYLKYYPPKSKVMGSAFVTDRYARFWQELQREAAKIDPDATIVAYNYFNYFAPPTPGTKLNRHILVGSYPSAGWFPRSSEEQAWFKQQWSRWQETGARLFSRGNYCLDGYAMPLVFAHQFADEFQHQASHGMEATDYDAITGQWAAQGTNLYLLMRLENRPNTPPDNLLGEYYSAFGEAASQVKAYFDYWEHYALTKRVEINHQYEDNTSRWRSFGVAAHLLFPPESFAAAAAILDRAQTAVADDAEASARVQFLRDGLVHARLCAAVSQDLSVRETDADPTRGSEALATLIAFRKAHEREWIANFNYCSWSEDAAWRMPAKLPAAVASTSPLSHGSAFNVQ